MRQLSEQLLLLAGIRALNTRALDGLRRVLRPDVLEAASAASGAARTVSRHSAYRLWPERDEAVADVSRHIFNAADFSDAGLGPALADYDRAVLEGVRDLQPAVTAGKEERRAVFRQVLAAYFERELRSDERMAAWVVHVAAITCSPLWKGPRPDAEARKLGRRLLAARADFNEAVIGEWAAMVWGAMARFGRRPRPGYTVRDIVQLVECMFDGAFLRLFVDPAINGQGARPAVDEDELRRVVGNACDAMFEIAWACSEPGVLADARRPGDLEGSLAGEFDVILDQVADAYQDAELGEVLVVRDVVKGNEELEAASRLFPEAGDLADSALRHLMKSGGEPVGWKLKDGEPWIRSTLHTLSRVAETHPALIAAAVENHRARPAASFVGELTAVVAGLLKGADSLWSEKPGKDASHLVQLALRGDSGWVGAEAILDLAAYRAAGE